MNFILDLSVVVEKNRPDFKKVIEVTWVSLGDSLCMNRRFRKITEYMLGE